jgi:hypothetical protein
MECAQIKFWAEKLSKIRKQQSIELICKMLIAVSSPFYSERNRILPCSRVILSFRYFPKLLQILG